MHRHSNKHTIYIMYMCVYTKGNIFALCTICEGEQDCTHEMYIFRHSPRITLLIRDGVEVTSIYICIHICTRKNKTKKPPQYEDVEWKLVASKLSTHDIQASLALENYALLFCIRRTRHCSVFCKFSATKIILRLLHSTCLNKQRNYTGKVAGKKRLLILMLCSFSQCLTNSTSDQACTENQNLTTLLLILVTLIKMAK